MNDAEVLAQADGVEDREPHLARRHRREEPQHRRLQHVDRGAAAFFFGGEHHHRMLFERHQRRQRGGRVRRPQPLVLRNAVLDVRQIERDAAEANRRGRFGRARPGVVVGGLPVGKQPLALGRDVAPGCTNGAVTSEPAFGERFPVAVVRACEVRGSARRRPGGFPPIAGSRSSARWASVSLNLRSTAAISCSSQCRNSASRVGNTLLAGSISASFQRFFSSSVASSFCWTDGEFLVALRDQILRLAAGTLLGGCGRGVDRRRALRPSSRWTT